jgi:hypothetical protein
MDICKGVGLVDFLNISSLSRIVMQQLNLNLNMDSMGAGPGCTKTLFHLVIVNGYISVIWQ